MASATESLIKIVAEGDEGRELLRKTLAAKDAVLAYKEAEQALYKAERERDQAALAAAGLMRESASKAPPG